MIDSFDLYIFDLDGTIIDSEYEHYLAYKKQLNIENYNEYCKLFHGLYNNINKNNLNYNKKYNDFKELYLKKIKYIEGFEIFFNHLIKKDKNICIVTDASKERCEFIKSLHPLLKLIDKWITKDDVKNPKPHTDGYIKALQFFPKIPMNKIIMFEDSYKGFNVIKYFDTTKIIISNKNYYYYNEIKEYTNLPINNSIIIQNYINIFNLQK